MIKYSSFVLSFFFLLSSCQLFNNNVRKRTSYGARPARAKSQNEAFNPVKKKIVLLPFFNESPFGGEDLAVVATEEFRRELSRTRDYSFDSSGLSLFGNSKQIYSGGGVKLGQLARKAKLSGINLVIYGRIIKAKVRQRSDEIGLVRKTKSHADSVV